MNLSLFTMGKLGLARKTITFKIEDFKTELAPTTAKFEYYELAKTYVERLK